MAQLPSGGTPTAAAIKALLEGEQAAFRAALGLGSASTQASNAFDTSGAAAAAANASQPLAAALTSLATTSPSAYGKALLEVTNALKAREAIETNSMAQFEANLRNGLPEKFWWGLTYPFSLNQLVAAENEPKYSRFVPHRDIICRGLSVPLIVAATANDKCAIAMKAANGTTTLAASGAVENKMNGALGRVDIDFTEDVRLESGVSYHPGFQYGTKGGTAATLGTFSVVSLVLSTLADAAGSVLPEHRATATNGATFPFATSPALAGSGTAYAVIVRER